MRETVTLTGIVLIASPIKEYDRRIELLTKERGKISAFAQGARKAGSALSACTIPFTFGEFTFYQGRDSYVLRSGTIREFFSVIAEDYDNTCYASYFVEMAKHFTEENMEAPDELLLLYITLVAIQNGDMPLRLIRIVYEMRSMMLQGQMVELFECLKCGKTGVLDVYFSSGGVICEDCAAKLPELRGVYPFELSSDAMYTLQFILTTPLEKLYSFLVSDEVLIELERFMKAYLGRFLPYKFQSLDFINENK